MKRCWHRFAAIAFAFAVAFVLAQPASAQRLENRRVQLVVGEQTTIRAEGVRSYSEGVEGIIKVALLPEEQEFVVAAINPGITSLLLIMQDGRQVRYTITVIRPEDGVQEGAVVERENIRLDLYFVQMQESSALTLGLGWPGQISVEGTLGLTFDPTRSGRGQLTQDVSTISAQIMPRLDMLHATGWARFMRHAILVTANGSAASYNSGGQVNFRVSGALAGSVESVNFGTNLSVTPRYDRTTGRVELTVNTTVSDLTEAGGDIPGTTNTSANTTVNLDLGESMALGGLTGTSFSQNKAGLPGLSQIPILGILFGTHAQRAEETENVVIIIPSVVEPVRRPRRQLIEEVLAIYRDFSGNVEGAALKDTVFPPP